MAPWVAQLFGIALAGLAGLVVAAAISWSAWAVRLPAAGGVQVGQSMVIPTATPVADFALQQTPALEAPPVLQMSPADATGTPEPAPSATALTAAAAWEQLSLELDRAWGIDTPRTVVLLENFVAQFPNNQAAREKLYAALLAYGGDLVTSGAVSEGMLQLRRAEQLLPDRPEVPWLLADLSSATNPDRANSP